LQPFKHRLDHVIEGKEAYASAVAQAITLAQENNIVTFGGIPTRAETGYGYIEKDAHNQVVSFKEKPDTATAEAYVASGHYLWNSGMFCIKAAVYLQELLQHSPAVYEASKLAYEAMDSQGFLPEEASLRIPNISVDYAVMEKSNRIKVVPFAFQWNDLGSFEAIWDYMVQTGEHQDNNLALNTQKHVEFLGLKDVIYVETPDAILITHKAYTQQVKNIYERLETEHPHLLK
jgi:mannose-1-phosphate guanylyltransferase